MHTYRVNMYILMCYYGCCTSNIKPKVIYSPISSCFYRHGMSVKIEINFYLAEYTNAGIARGLIFFQS